jgi:hypothetical protein
MSGHLHASVALAPWKEPPVPILMGRLEVEMSQRRPVNFVDENLYPMSGQAHSSQYVNLATLAPVFNLCYCHNRWPGSSVGIAIGYGLGGPGIESRWRRDLPHLSRPALGPTQPPVRWASGLPWGRKLLERDADLSPPSSAVV